MHPHQPRSTKAVMQSRKAQLHVPMVRPSSASAPSGCQRADCIQAVGFFFQGGGDPSRSPFVLLSAPLCRDKFPSAAASSSIRPSLSHSRIPKRSTRAAIVSSRFCKGIIAFFTAAVMSAAIFGVASSGERPIDGAGTIDVVALASVFCSAGVCHAAGQITAGFPADGHHLSTGLLALVRGTAFLITARPSSCCSSVHKGGSSAPISQVLR